VFYFFGWVTSSLYSWQSYSLYRASEVYNLSIHIAGNMALWVDVAPFPHFNGFSSFIFDKTAYKSQLFYKNAHIFQFLGDTRTF
jgi:hypothetical protein